MPNHDILIVPVLVATQAIDAALVTSESEFTRHNLPDTHHRLLFVREGNLVVQVNNVLHRLTQDQALIVRSGNPFTRTHPENALLRYYAIRFTVDNSLDWCRTSMDVPALVTLDQPQRVEDLFRMLLNEQSDGLMEQRFAQMLFTQVLCEIADGERRRVALHRCCIPLVERAKAHIRAHYDRPISTTTVAKTVDCSPGYLSRAFKSATGGTVTAFIHEVRLFRAKLLLTETNKPVSQIARECGFENPGYFQRLFHRHEKMSPGDYRKHYSRIYTITIQ